MAPKQREMDDVLKRVFECLTRRDEEDGTRSLLIMVGDHGMTAVRPTFIVSVVLCSFPHTSTFILQNGNHGGSSSGETSAVSTEAVSRHSVTNLYFMNRPCSLPHPPSRGWLRHLLPKFQEFYRRTTSTITKLYIKLT